MPDNDHGVREEIVLLRDTLAGLQESMGGVQAAIDLVNRRLDDLEAQVSATETDPKRRRRHLWVVPGVAAVLLPLKLFRDQPGRTAAAVTGVGIGLAALSIMQQPEVFDPPPPEPGIRVPLPVKPPSSKQRQDLLPASSAADRKRVSAVPGAAAGRGDGQPDSDTPEDQPMESARRSGTDDSEAHGNSAPRKKDYDGCLVKVRVVARAEVRVSVCSPPGFS